MSENNNENQGLAVNETAAAYLDAKPAAILDVATEKPPLSRDKYTCGVPDADKMTDEEMDALIEESFASIRAGRYSTPEEVWERLRQKHGLNI
jgi:hypothetical protein